MQFTRDARTHQGVHMEQQTRGEGLARGLGWFSIGLGLAEIASPQSVAQLVGIEDGTRTRALIRGYCAREIANGVAILSQPDARWLWARVAGDVVDLSSLAATLQRPDTEARRGRVAFGLASVAGVMVADIVAARQLGSGSADSLRQDKRKDNTVRVSKTFTINRSREEVYGFWRKLDNLPRFMTHLESVELLGNNRSRWTARAARSRRAMANRARQEEDDESHLLDGNWARRSTGRARAEGDQRARRNRARHEHRDLRFGSSPSRRIHSDDAEGGRHRSRVH